MHFLTWFKDWLGKRGQTIPKDGGLGIFNQEYENFPDYMPVGYYPGG